MGLEDVVKNNHYPIIFIGSGIEKRYLKNFPTGDISSNRYNGIPDSLSKGENSILRIGIGLKNQSNGLTVKFGNLVWKGSIQ